MLMFHIIKPDWKAGTIERVSTTFLHDPDRKVPFRIVNENTPKRYLTGSDFDLESIQPIGDALWFGEEFGPFLIKTDRSGKVLTVFQTQVDGKGRALARQSLGGRRRARLARWHSRSGAARASKAWRSRPMARRCIRCSKAR